MYARSKTPSMGTPSVYSIHASHLTLRSSNLRSTRSMKSLRVPWYQRPILQDAYFLDTQRGALVIAFYSLVIIREAIVISLVNFFFLIFSVSEYFYISHVCVRHLLSGYGGSRIYPLRVLFY